MDNTRLEKCPLCHTENVEVYYNYDETPDTYGMYVKCPSCGSYKLELDNYVSQVKDGFNND